MKLMLFVAATISITCGFASAERTVANENRILFDGSKYFCTVDKHSVHHLSDRASWDSDVVFALDNFRPVSLTLSFSLIQEGETFSAEMQTISNSNPRVGRNEIRAVLEQGNGLITILFYGVLGQGTITSSIKQAGNSVPARMAWTDISGSFYNDAFMYCMRVG